MEMQHIENAIVTDRLILIPFTENFLEELVELNSDHEVMKWISDPLSRKQVKAVIEWFKREWVRLGYGWYAILNKENDDFIGQVGLQKLEGKFGSPDVELAFVIKKEEWGNGYATEASEATLNFGFQDAHLKEIFATTMRENLKAKKVLRKLSFRFDSERQLYGKTVDVYKKLPH